MLADPNLQPAPLPPSFWTRIALVFTLRRAPAPPPPQLHNPLTPHSQVLAEVLLSAGYMSYLGPLPGSYRKQVGRYCISVICRGTVT